MFRFHRDLCYRGPSQTRREVCMGEKKTALRGARHTREREVESWLVTLANRQGWMCIKFIPDNMPGMPDRMILMPGGRVVWVELKRPAGGVVAELQKVRGEQLERAGQEVRLVLTREQAEELVLELRGRRSP